MQSKKADLLFMRWKAELANSDRTWASVESNFNNIWEQMFRSKIRMDDALEYMSKVCSAHHPSDQIIKKSYHNVKNFGYDSWRDYGDQWKEKINNKSKEVFFAYYEIDGTQKSGTGKIGGMTRAEHSKLQRYADSHETVDWESLVEEQEEHDKRVKESEEDEIDIDLSQVDINVDLGDL